MPTLWFQLALGVGRIGVIAVALRRRRVAHYSDPDIEMDTVSEGWLGGATRSARTRH